MWPPKKPSPENCHHSTYLEAPEKGFILGAGLYLTWLGALSMQTALSHGRSPNTVCANCLTSQPPTARIPVGNKRRTKKPWKGKQEWGVHRGLCKALTQARSMCKAVHITKRDRRGRSQQPRLDDGMPFKWNVQNGQIHRDKKEIPFGPKQGKGKGRGNEYGISFCSDKYVLKYLYLESSHGCTALNIFLKNLIVYIKRVNFMACWLCFKKHFWSKWEV